MLKPRFYAVVTLRNINGLIKEATAMLQRNKDHLNQIIPNIKDIAKNTALISEEVKISSCIRKWRLVIPLISENLLLKISMILNKKQMIKKWVTD